MTMPVSCGVPRQKDSNYEKSGGRARIGETGDRAAVPAAAMRLIDVMRKEIGAAGVGLNGPLWSCRALAAT